MNHVRRELRLRLKPRWGSAQDTVQEGVWGREPPAVFEAEPQRCLGRSPSGVCGGAPTAGGTPPPFLATSLNMILKTVMMCPLAIKDSDNVYIHLISFIHRMILATQYADFKTFTGLRVVMNNGSHPMRTQSARNVYDCGLKCRRSKGCLGFNFNWGSKECEVLKVQ